MSDDKLSQNDIDALIAKVRGVAPAPQEKDNSAMFEQLGITELDLKGLSKLFKISIEASSEVLKSITQKDITIDSIGEIKLAGRKEISELIEPPFIATKVEYTVGLRGLDLLLIKQTDMNNLMRLQFESMGYSPDENDQELILSASNEVMNQMLGNASNKLGNALGIFIDISTPESHVIDSDGEGPTEITALKEDSSSYIYTTFKLNIGGQVTGDLIKVLDSDFIEELRDIMHKGNYLDEWKGSTEENNEVQEIEESSNFNHSVHAIEEDTSQFAPNDPSPLQFSGNESIQHTQLVQQAPYEKPTNIMSGEDVPVTKYVLPQLSNDTNIEPRLSSTNRIKSVEVELTVELGRTKMKVKDILELDKGSIIELNRLAGEHVDLYANGTLISKGEVVVIKDNFAFRVLSIVEQDYR